MVSKYRINTKGSAMNEFLYLIRGGATPDSPEQMQKRIEKWLVWMKQLDAKGHIKDRGNPLENSGKVVSGRHKAISDGPYAEAKEAIGGYMLILAKDLSYAAEIAKGCPILEVGGSVEIRPIHTLEI
jgi:hypothetical protein